MNYVKSIRNILSIVALISITSLSHSTLASQPIEDRDKVIEVVRLMYVALTHDDLGQFNNVASSDFYAFDVGKRLTGNELMELVKNAHAAGKVYVWQVTEPQVHIDGSIAWITYVNRGSLQDAAGKKELAWLESAVLRKENGVWRIQFFHSTRVPSE
jgi:ketosteroid isomerase-like protein